MQVEEEGEGEEERGHAGHVAGGQLQQGRGHPRATCRHGPCSCSCQASSLLIWKCKLRLHLVLWHMLALYIHFSNTIYLFLSSHLTMDEFKHYFVPIIASWIGIFIVSLEVRCRSQLQCVGVLINVGRDQYLHNVTQFIQFYIQSISVRQGRRLISTRL